MKQLTVLSICIVLLCTSCIKDVLLDGNGNKPPSKPPIVSYTSATNTYTQNVAITQLTPANTGGASSNWSVTPALPVGISISATTGAISGTPTIPMPTTDYIVKAANSKGISSTTLTLTVNAAAATIVPDGSQFQVSVQDDTISNHSDGTLIYYKASASKSYLPNEDAPVTQGGYIFMESYEKYVNPIDGSVQYPTLAVNVLPYVANQVIPMSIGISSNSKGGRYHIYVSRNTLPAASKIWIRDAVLKDSLEISNGVAEYHFNAYKADTTSIGMYRFSVVVR